MSEFEVTVGNIGSVYAGNQLKPALEAYAGYKDQSKTGYGRAAGEQVVLWKYGEPWREHEGTQQEEESDENN